MAKVKNVLGFVLLQSVLLIATVDAQFSTECVTPNGENLLPSVCGRDLSFRVFGGTRTDIDEYPWMALIEYTHLNGKSTSCGAVLISKRYVLTAAHCLDPQGLPRTWNPSGVRLGEYDTSQSVDCLSVDDLGGQVCADPTVTVGIERKIIHEAYRAGSVDQKNDIALIRMSQDVTFTNYISPICLPSTPTVPSKAWVAGWGKTEKTTNSAIKLKLELSIVDMDACANVYAAKRQVGAGQICAGGTIGKDSCRGDSGGPLMYSDKNRDGSRRWTAIGIVSYGPTPCGMEGWPGVYTKVYDYISWINSKLLP